MSHVIAYVVCHDGAPNKKNSFTPIAHSLTRQAHTKKGE